jgi:ribonuclease P protein component
MLFLQNNSNKRNTLPKSGILRGSGSFDRVFEKSRRIKGRTVDVRFLFIPELPAAIKAGFVAGKKTGNAVYRNRNKRLMREAYRTNKSILEPVSQQLTEALHIVFIAHKGDKTFSDVQDDIRMHLDHIRQQTESRLQANL